MGLLCVSYYISGGACTCTETAVFLSEMKSLGHRVCASSTLLDNASVIALIVFLLEICRCCSTTLPDFKMLSSHIYELLSHCAFYLQFA